jgi:hypothetical protein
MRPRVYSYFPSLRVRSFHGGLSFQRCGSRCWRIFRPAGATHVKYGSHWCTLSLGNNQSSLAPRIEVLIDVLLKNTAITNRAVSGVRTKMASEETSDHRTSESRGFS